jgi:hypothetical protein
MNSTLTRNVRSIIAGSVILGSLALAGTAFAATTPPAQGRGGFGHGGQHPAVVGTVTTISGDTLTVTSTGWSRGPKTTTTPAPTTYTVDATNATVTKAGVSSTVSAIVSGDTVMVQGTVTGTNVVATKINDGKMPMTGRGIGKTPGNKPATTTPLIQGNGNPVIGGTVTALSGTTVTVTAKSGTVYTVDVTSATVEKMGAVSTIGTIASGDNVVIQGTVQGTSVTASSVIDQGAPTTATTSSTNTNPQATRGGFMGAVGGFFSHLFGFF